MDDNRITELKERVEGISDKVKRDERRPDKWSLGKWEPTDSQTTLKAEDDYALQRFINGLGVAEGSNLPPLYRNNVRVQAPTGFRVARQENVKFASRFILAWNNNRAMEMLDAKYRIYTYAQQNVMPMTTTQNVATPDWTGPLLADVIANASPCEVVVPCLRRQPVVFALETRLPNGLVSSTYARPYCAAVCDPKFHYTRNVSTTHACTIDDEMLFCDTTAAGFTVTLFGITQLPDGYMYIFRNTGANNLTVAGHTASETIDGGASITVAAGASSFIFSSGSLWYT